jgi:hypothetical protein
MLAMAEFDMLEPPPLPEEELALSPLGADEGLLLSVEVEEELESAGALAGLLQPSKANDK